VLMEIAVDFLFLVKVRFVSGAENTYPQRKPHPSDNAVLFCPLGNRLMPGVGEYKTRKGN